MKHLKMIDEYNSGGHLIYSVDHVGAYVRGRTREEALKKLPSEIARYHRWLGGTETEEDYEIVIVQEKISDLQICDADSDVIFDSELLPLTQEEYQKLKTMVLKSAKDFLTMYQSVPDKTGTVLSSRKTFYGEVPITAQKMYEHTKNVNNYYFGEINVPATNETDIDICRARAFEILESQPDFLRNTVYDGSYGEQWSLRKVCRRFIWHDCIHAKAMYRMAVKLCGKENVQNPFCFEVLS